MKSPPIVFENPPVNEVVAAAYFQPPLLNLRNEHIGLFWAKIKKDFPVVEQQPSTSFELNAAEPFPMPRYWFIAKDEINLIQIQKNAFMFNWRRRKNAYPQFHKHIKPGFDKYYGLFSEFIQEEANTQPPPIDFCELSYINILERCEYWVGPQDTAKVIPSFSILNPGMEDLHPPVFNCNFTYGVSADTQLHIGIRNGIKDQQQDAPVLLFEIKAFGRLGQVEKPRADEWFERAHAAIIKCFLEMTSPDIQKRFWKPVEKTQ